MALEPLVIVFLKLMTQSFYIELNNKGMKEGTLTPTLSLVGRGGHRDIVDD